MTDKRQKAIKVKCKREESLTKQSIVLLQLVDRWTQHLTDIDQKTRNIGQVYIWKPMTTGIIM